MEESRPHFEKLKTNSEQTPKSS